MHHTRFLVSPEISLCCCWLICKDRFLVSEYTEEVTATIYYFKKFDSDLSGALNKVEYRPLDRIFLQTSHIAAARFCRKY